MPDITQRVNFLKKMHLFRGLKDDQLIQVAREFTELPPFEAQQTVFKQDTKGDALFIIYTGKVSVKFTSNGNVKSATKILATLIPGDYFGEEALSAVTYDEADWASDPWAGGGYSAYMPPGVWTGFGEALAAPVGRIHWAGSEVAERWGGFFEGALLTGEAAATAVLAKL